MQILTVLTDHCSFRFFVSFASFFLNRASLLALWLVFVYLCVFCMFWLFWIGCQYKCSRLPGKTHLRNDTLHVK